MTVLRHLLALAAGLAALVLAIPAFLAVLPFMVVRRATEWLATRRTPVLAEGDPFIAFDEAVGWTPRRNLDTHATDLNGDVFHFTTDADGWRGRRSLDEADVVVFGDSFAFGFAADDREFFADLDPGFPIKAIGAPGYNMVQSLLWMRALQDRLKGKTVVWLVYGPNDFEDNIRPSMLQYRMPFLRERTDGTWEVVTDHLSEKPWPFPSRKRHYETYVDICTGGDLTRRVFAACREILTEAKALCDSAGARLVVLSVPELSPLARGQMERAVDASPNASTFEPDLPDRKLAQVCEDLGVEFKPLAAELGPDDYLAYDVHWNGSGHRKVHELLKTIWRQTPGAEGAEFPFDSPTPVAVGGS